MGIIEMGRGCREGEEGQRVPAMAIYKHCMLAVSDTGETWQGGLEKIYNSSYSILLNVRSPMNNDIAIDKYISKITDFLIS